ncbi:minor capsid protein [Pseudoclavibacter sp. CFCC 11306]|uniref:minor capsid protein n=1 Tax=Pseudoclavibacter sp. CFCC 11306 TaxID=1564493 RepID=UPI00130181EB|nr:minor capsid protein [Pseudoclavibacter sp. CFCC 11306]KAB1659009.1 hypothetical protein F8O09_05440 [Pseudoclavibacter sp. CFCC 11306]
MTGRIPTYTRQVLDGLAQLLADNGIGVYKPDGYAVADVGIVFGTWPKTPATAIKLNAYDEVIGEAQTTTLYMQVATRVSKSYLASLDMVDAIRDLLHRRTDVHLGAVTVAGIEHISTAYLGKDTATDLHEHTLNFRLLGGRWTHPVTDQ